VHDNRYALGVQCGWIIANDRPTILQAAGVGLSASNGAGYGAG
jgi:hypothetical protein